MDALVATGLKKSFPLGSRGRQVPVLRGIDMRIRPGERVALIGPSGSGKSTLLACLSGVLSPDEGTLRCQDRLLDRAGSRGQERFLRDTLGLITQDYRLVSSLTARENIEFAQRIRRHPDAALVTGLLHALGLAPLAEALPDRLSGGEQQRVAIARAIACHPRIILADEPTSALDTHNGSAVMNLLTDLGDSGTATVLVTHDLGAAARCDRVYLLRDGQILGELHAPSHAAVLAAFGELS